VFEYNIVEASIIFAGSCVKIDELNFQMNKIKLILNWDLPTEHCSRYLSSVRAGKIFLATRLTPRRGGTLFYGCGNYIPAGRLLASLYTSRRRIARSPAIVLQIRRRELSPNAKEHVRCTITPNRSWEHLHVRRNLVTRTRSRFPGYDSFSLRAVVFDLGSPRIKFKYFSFYYHWSLYLKYKIIMHLKFNIVISLIP
jgi:hypothetical protein